MWFTACWLFASQKDGLSAPRARRSWSASPWRSCGRAGTGSPDGDPPGRVRGVLAFLHHRSHRTGIPRDHRRLECLPGHRPARLHPRTSQSERCPPARRGPRRPAAGSPPGRVCGQTVAAGNTSGLGDPGAPGRLSGRVRFPLQPVQLTQSGNAVLPIPGTRRRPCPRQIPRHRRRHTKTGPPRPPREATRQALTGPAPIIPGAPQPS